MIVIAISVLVALFLVVPLLITVPMSFSTVPSFQFPPSSYGFTYYKAYFTNPDWIEATSNSIVIALFTTILTLLIVIPAAMAFVRYRFGMRKQANILIMLPMMMPHVVAALAFYSFFSYLGMSGTKLGMVLAHTALATPFVVITVTATLSTYDANLTRAALSLGAPQTSAFFRVTLPNIMPGVVSGAIFAFATSFDEVVVALFMTAAEQRTLPVQMFSGIRDQINPTIMAAATLLLALSILLFLALAFLTRRRAG